MIVKKILVLILLSFTGNASAELDADVVRADGRADFYQRIQGEDPERAMNSYRFDTHEVAGRKDNRVVVPSDLYWHGPDEDMESLYVQKTDGKWNLVARGTQMTLEQAKELKARLRTDEGLERLLVDKHRNVLFFDPVESYLPRDGVRDDKPICLAGYRRSGVVPNTRRSSIGDGSGGDSHSNFYNCSCSSSYRRKDDGYSLCTSNLAKGYSMLGTAISALFAPLTGTLVLPREIDTSELQKVIVDIRLSELLWQSAQPRAQVREFQ